MRPKSRTGLTAIVLLLSMGSAIGARAAAPIAVFSSRSEPAAIVSIVPEGSRVERGQVVCELDPGNLKERLAAQEIATKGAEANYQNAKFTREVAEIAVVEYIDGAYNRELQTIRGEIELAKSEKVRAQDRLEWSKRMVDRGFVSRAQNISDKVSLQKKTYALERAETKKKVLEEYTKKKTKKELESEVEKARADELAKQATWEREKLTLAGLRREVAACTLVAPASGRVVYARPQFRFLPAVIETGATVRPEQLVFLVMPMAEETASGEPAKEGRRELEVRQTELPYQVTIVSIVPDGTLVERGQLVCELDSSGVKDRLLTQEIATKAAEAANHNAKLTREAAEIAAKEYVEGIAKQEEAKLQGEIELAKARIDLSKERFERAGREPKDAGFTRKEAEIKLKRAQFALEQATDKLRLLTKYTIPRMTHSLNTEVEKASSEELARQATLEMQRSKRSLIERQLAGCKLVAPEAGKVEYARRPDRLEDAGRPLPPLIEKGAIVQPKQLIFRIVPTQPSDEAPK